MRTCSSYLGICLCLLLLSPSLRAQQPQTQERDVIAVVYGILSYARWPQPREPLRLCVTGSGAFGDQLLQVPDSQDPWPQTNRRVEPSSAAITAQCDAVFIGQLDANVRSQLLSGLTGHAVLTISENQNGCSEGSLFCFKAHGAQLGFAVNLDAVARSGLRIHPQVLRLGRRQEVQP